MRICSRCAAHLPADTIICPKCGGMATYAVRDGDIPDESVPPTRTVSLPVLRRIADVQDSWIRRSVECGFILGCGGAIFLSIAALLSMPKNTREHDVVGVVIMLICSPFIGLLGAVSFGVLHLIGAMFVSLVRRGVRLPPRSALAMTDSLDARGGRRHEGSADIVAPGTVALPDLSVTRADTQPEQPS